MQSLEMCLQAARLDVKRVRKWSMLIKKAEGGKAGVLLLSWLDSRSSKVNNRKKCSLWSGGKGKRESCEHQGDWAKSPRGRGRGRRDAKKRSAPKPETSRVSFPCVCISHHLCCSQLEESMGGTGPSFPGKHGGYCPTYEQDLMTETDSSFMLMTEHLRCRYWQ